MLVMVYRFFNFLILKRNKYKTLLVYRSALKRPIKSLFPHYNIESDENLKNLMLCVKNKFKKSIETPLWDLDKVLKYIRSITKNDVETYVKKCFFLVLLASRRIAEFKALVVSRLMECSDGSIILRPHSKFLKKNHTGKFYPQDIPIPSFIEDLNICPVHHLKSYLKITSDIFKNSKKKRPDQLWIDMNGKSLNLSKMRSWFREIVFKGDSEASNENTKFHSIRAVAAST